MKDKPIRSIAKAITWRVIATITTFSLAYFVFQEDEYVLQKASLVASAESILKLIFYYLHERGWEYFSLGKTR